MDLWNKVTRAQNVNRLLRQIAESDMRTHQLDCLVEKQRKLLNDEKEKDIDGSTTSKQEEIEDKIIRLNLLQLDEMMIWEELHSELMEWASK